MTPILSRKRPAASPVPQSGYRRTVRLVAAARSPADRRVGLGVGAGVGVGVGLGWLAGETGQHRRVGPGVVDLQHERAQRGVPDDAQRARIYLDSLGHVQ